MSKIEKRPILADLPLNHPIRSVVNYSLQTFANIDRMKDYTLNRNAPLYISQFNGLRCFFEYLKSLRTNGVWLDIGTGIGLAAHQLSQDPMTEGLSLKGTTLVRVNDEKYYIPADNLIETSVEYLEGIENESVSGITGMDHYNWID